MFTSESFLDQFIGNQRRAIRYHLLFAIGLPGFGVAVIAGAYLWPGTTVIGQLREMIGIAGGFVSALSTFPIREILSRKERIAVLETVKVRLQSAEQAELPRIEELVWKLVEKTAVG